MLKIFLKGPSGNEVMLNRAQLAVVMPLLNRRTPRHRLNSKCLEALLAAGIPPDFKSVSGTTIRTSYVCSKKPFNLAIPSLGAYND